MTTRTRQETVRFNRSFFVPGLEEMLPAGEYCVEVDEELLEGVSFVAYRRVLVMLQLPPSLSRPGRRETLAMDPSELDAALAFDRGPEGNGDS